jgi:uncharacterized membrane protein
MANNKHNSLSKKTVLKQVKKNTEKGKIIKVIVVVVAIVAFVVVSKLVIGDNSENTNKPVSASSATDTKDVGDKKLSNTNSSNLVSGIEIKEVDVTDRASYYDYDAGGTVMQVIALKAQDGSIKTVLNTCQVCYDSGKGYYIQVEDEEGEELVCQNCGNMFPPDQLGIIKDGCNPIPIPPSSVSDDGTTIKIDKNFLDGNKAYFTNWRKQLE